MSQALIPAVLSKSPGRLSTKVAVVLGGIGLMALLARVIIPLPWSPVPITGQTFGVALIALTAGRKYAVTIMAAYLALGFAGAPMFANVAKAGILMPTLGYLLGFFVAALVVGELADRGWTRSFGRALLAAYIGSACIFICGLIVLSFFVPASALLTAGLFPFMLGDLIKNVLAASIASGAQRIQAKA
jgi:biotin transport system substrate-specific component